MKNNITIEIEFINNEKLRLSWIATSVLIVLVTLSTLYLMNLLGMHIAWPAFTVLNLIFIIGATKKNIITVFASSVSGILFGVIFLHMMEWLTPVFGANLTIYVVLFTILTVLIGLQEVLPIICNTYAFVVLTYALVDATGFAQAWPMLLLTVFFGGGIALVGCLGVLKFMGKYLENNDVKIGDSVEITIVD